MIDVRYENVIIMPGTEKVYIKEIKHTLKKQDLPFEYLLNPDMVYGTTMTNNETFIFNINSKVMLGENRTYYPQDFRNIMHRLKQAKPHYEECIKHNNLGPSAVDVEGIVIKYNKKRTKYGITIFIEEIKNGIIIHNTINPPLFPPNNIKLIAHTEISYNEFDRIIKILSGINVTPTISNLSTYSI